MRRFFSSFLLVVGLFPAVVLAESVVSTPDPCTLLTQADVEGILQESVVRAGHEKQSKTTCLYRPIDILDSKSGVMVIGLSRTEMKDIRDPKESDDEIISRRIAALKTTFEVQK